MTELGLDASGALAKDRLHDGLAAFARGRRERDIAIRSAAAAGLAPETIAETCSITPVRALEIINTGEAPAPAVVLRGMRCPYCRDGRVEAARACTCQLPGAGCDGRCQDGWLYVFDFCGCDAGHPR